MSASVRVADGARWDCGSCGACCRLFTLGPVEDQVVSWLEENHIEEHWEPAAQAPWREKRVGPDGREAWFLTKRDGHCVFLSDDNRCAVHSTFGAERKPTFCREFPFHVIEDPKGTAVVVRPDCGGWHETHKTGTPLVDQLPAILALSRTSPRRSFAPTHVSVTPEIQVDLETWMKWEEELIAMLQSDARSPESSVALLRERLFSLAGQEPPVAEARRYRAACGATLEAIIRLMAKVRSQGASGDAAQEQFLDQMIEAAATAQRTPPAALAADAKDYLQLVLRGELLSKGFASAGGVAEGLGRFLVGVEVARRREGTMSAGEISALFAPWQRFAAHPGIQAVLRLARPALVDVFLHAGGTK